MRSVPWSTTWRDAGVLSEISPISPVYAVSLAETLLPTHQCVSGDVSFTRNLFGKYLSLLSSEAPEPDSDSEGQGSLACGSSRGHKVRHD